MASEQAITNEAIAKAVTELTKAAIQAIAAATGERPKGLVGPKIDRPAMEQPSFNWEVDDKYSKLKIFRLEVNNITYNTPQAEQPTIVKIWPAIHRITHTCRKRYMIHIGRFEK